MQWYHCVRCRQDGTVLAIKCARAAGETNDVVRRIHQEAHAVCGWMTTMCRHKAQCIAGDPPEVVLLESQRQQGLRPSQEEATRRAPEDVQTLCKKMEALAGSPEHVAAHEKAEKEFVARQARQVEMAQRRASAEMEDRISKKKAYAAKKRREAIAEGLVEMRCDPGPPLQRDHFEMDMQPYLTGITWEMVSDCTHGEVRYVTDLARDRRRFRVTPQFFFDQIRRFRAGLVRVFVPAGQALDKPHLIVESAKTRDEDAFVSMDDEMNDIPVDLYDGGDSEAWKEKQRSAERQLKHDKSSSAAPQDRTVTAFLGAILEKK